ncbi:DUF6597 domain-containing transcriptional factor [Paenibacillaceae bacterium WGS1546]|uniref:DUF6597 domain-containing transcriptional factor n=1 Tax=Cohnella sp. WGS1546 TaxID=3366810 RepID=UPI00372D209F
MEITVSYDRAGKGEPRMKSEIANDVFFIRTYVPQEPLSAFVDYFWYLHGYNPSHQKELAIPDGSAELIIDLRAENIRLFDQRHTTLNLDSSIVCGPHSEHFIIDTAQEATVLGIHFKPGGAARFLRTPLNELHNSHVSLDALWGLRARDLRDRLLHAATPERRFRILEQFLETQNKSLWHPEPAIQFALAELQSLPHTGILSDTIERTGLSAKKFIQLFKEEVGMTPKRFCRVMRFQEALIALGQGKPIDWVHLAIACGYYDQAHFIREFRAFSGLTPTEYEPVAGRHRNHARLT